MLDTVIEQKDNLPPSQTVPAATEVTEQGHQEFPPYSKLLETGRRLKREQDLEQEIMLMQRALEIIKAEGSEGDAKAAQNALDVYNGNGVDYYSSLQRAIRVQLDPNYGKPPKSTEEDVNIVAAAVKKPDPFEDGREKPAELKTLEQHNEELLRKAHEIAQRNNMSEKEKNFYIKEVQDFNDKLREKLIDELLNQTQLNPAPLSTDHPVTSSLSTGP